MSKITKNKKTAIVLFNLGGPDSTDAIKTFLFNLFMDKNVITVPVFFRFFIAWFISFKREKVAKEIYSHIGGKSSLLEKTEEQADYLRTKLKGELSDFEVFVCMRHWHPMSPEVIDKIIDYEPDEIILLPLYPQFSTTTTHSSIEDFKNNLQKSSLKDVCCKAICCYPSEENFIKSHVSKIEKAIGLIKDNGAFRVLFSAHGLPKKIIDSGDPYQWQVEYTVNSILENISFDNLDFKISYQSRVGPIEWIKPDTEDEIILSGKEKKNLIVVPISFVSEHVETLVELDIEYKKIADNYSVDYVRVPTLSTDDLFIESLKDIILKANKKDGSFTFAGDMARICPNDFSKCECR